MMENKDTIAGFEKLYTREKILATYQIKYIDTDQTWITELIEADEIWTPDGALQFRRNDKTVFWIRTPLVHSYRNVSELDMKNA